MEKSRLVVKSKLNKWYEWLADNVLKVQLQVHTQLKV